MKLAPALTNPIPECPHRSCILKLKTCINYSTSLCSTPATMPTAASTMPPLPSPSTNGCISLFPPPRERSNGPMHEHAVEAIRLKASPPRLTEGSLSTHGSCFVPFAISILLRPVGQRNLFPRLLITRHRVHDSMNLSFLGASHVSSFKRQHLFRLPSVSSPNVLIGQMPDIQSPQLPSTILSIVLQKPETFINSPIP